MGMSVASILHARTCIMDVNRTTLEDVAGDTYKYILIGPRKHDCDLMARMPYPEHAIRNARPARVSCRMHPERARNGRRVGESSVVADSSAQCLRGQGSESLKI
jgi:hypothetical protein